MKPRSYTFALIVVLIVFVSVSIGAQGPTPLGIPSATNNVPQLINIGNTTQTKRGKLVLDPSGSLLLPGSSQNILETKGQNITIKKGRLVSDANTPGSDTSWIPNGLLSGLFSLETDSIIRSNGLLSSSTVYTSGELTAQSLILPDSTPNYTALPVERPLCSEKATGKLILCPPSTGTPPGALPQITATLSATPTTIPSGQTGSVTINLSSTAATQCIPVHGPLAFNFAEYQTTGTWTVPNVSPNTTFAVVCVDSTGRAARAQLRIGSGSPPTGGSSSIMGNTISGQYYFTNKDAACTGYITSREYYAYEPLTPQGANDTLGVNDILYDNSAKTVPFNGFDTWVALTTNGVGAKYALKIGSNGKIASILPCN